jgi:hypothetical protein
MSRPRVKLSAPLIAKLADLIKAGNYPITAARAAGIPERTWYDWLKKGRERSSGLQVELVKAVYEAESAAEAWHVANIRKAAAGGTWQASAWFLERKAHERWKKRDRQELAGDGAQVVTHLYIPDNGRDGAEGAE